MDTTPEPKVAPYEACLIRAKYDPNSFIAIMIVEKNYGETYLKGMPVFAPDNSKEDAYIFSQEDAELWLNSINQKDSFEIVKVKVKPRTIELLP